MIPTYTLSTAQGILKLFRISLTIEALRAVIESQNTFYKHLLSTYAALISGHSAVQSAVDTQAYADQQLWDIRVDQVEEQARADESGTPLLLNREQDQIFGKLETEFSRLQETLSKIKTSLDQVTQKIDGIIQKQIIAWNTLQEKNVDTIIQALTAKGLVIPPEFREKLLIQLQQSIHPDVMSTIAETLKQFQLSVDQESLQSTTTPVNSENNIFIENAKAEAQSDLAIVHRSEPDIKKLEGDFFACAQSHSEFQKTYHMRELPIPTSTGELILEPPVPAA